MTGGVEVRRARESDLAEVVLLERETSTSPHWVWAEYAGMLCRGTMGACGGVCLWRRTGRIYWGLRWARRWDMGWTRRRSWSRWWCDGRLGGKGLGVRFAGR